MKKRNDGLDFSDVQELSVEVMRKFPSSSPKSNFMWSKQAEELCEEADKRIAKGTYSKAAHKTLRIKLFESLDYIKNKAKQ